MLTTTTIKRYYRAILDKDPGYEGIFFVGVRTTGVFCRPTCPARKPKFENCEFFATGQEALLASYRPCKRCQPLSHPNRVPDTVRRLVEAVEANPEKRWREADFAALSVDASTARRQFKRRFGMTFIEYARARRMGLAMKQIRKGRPVIDAQLESGYESGSGFRDAFSRIMGDAPSRAGECAALRASWLDTRLGPMLAIADEQALFLLEFVDRRGLEGEIERLRRRTHCVVIPGRTPPIDRIQGELEEYFTGRRLQFKTPLRPLGSPFQRRVWEQLQAIPPGETRAYAELAAAVGKPSAFRAVARANGANQLAIVVPCHRVINANGELGGYGGGLARKSWLINHEKEAISHATAI